MASDKQDPKTTGVRNFRLVGGNTAQPDIKSKIASVAAAQVVLALGAVVGIAYAGRLPLVTILSSAILAFSLAPFVERLERARVPCWCGSLLSVLFLLACVWGLGYISYNRAIDFVHQLPQYKQRIEQSMARYRRLIPNQAGGNSQATQNSPESAIPQGIANSASGFSDALLCASFVPFLVYFMLSSKDRTHNATVNLFAPQNRPRARDAIDSIAGLCRAFIGGNLLCCAFMTLVCTGVFWAIGLPYFYFLGILSGVFSLVPYLGAFLGVLPPVAAGLGQLSGEKILGLVLFTAGLHVTAINIFLPKVVGKRLNLNPLVVTIALLVWGWIWGAMGLILAVPVTGALKTICDHVDSLKAIGAWMEEGN